MTQAHPAFTAVNQKPIDSLNINIEEYRHNHTGAQHIHIQADNKENVFLVALRTVPEDSTGVAHILEHTALCGSKKYPVRDPFFMMIRRSLNTFMNAFTSSDWTAYPFASQNRKDFDNLLDVYLDAVFFSRLDPLDFAQEGHRLDFAEPGNTESPLVYKGVVYNEMKGAMSSVNSQLWQTLSKYLYPTSTYHHNSGGEPQAIPDLSYEQLQHFYKSHYHPSNAIFMTFGDIDAATHQNTFEENVLQHFEPLQETIKVEPEKRYFSPVRVEEAYAYQAQEGEDASHKSQIVMGWLLGPSIDLKNNLEMQLISSLLFEDSASPLQHKLETTELGASPSPLCGVDDSQYEMLFVCGLADTAAENASAVEELVTQTLQEIVDKGLPQEQIEASLHQIELQQREIGGDGYPYGLQLVMKALSAATHRGDVLSALDLETSLQELRESIKDPDYIPGLIKKWLLDNPHRVTLTLRPDADYQAREIAAEEAQLAEIKAGLDEAQKQAIVEQAKALDERQQQEDDKDILPKVTLEDIPAEMKFPQSESVALGKQDSSQHRLTRFPAGTNGLSYQQVIARLPDLSADEMANLPWYSLLLTEVGLAGDSYMSVQKRQTQVIGAINNFYSIHGDVNDPQQASGYITLWAKALNSRQQAMGELMRDTLNSPRFDEQERIAELVTHARLGREQSLTGNGHALAMMAASANSSPIARSNHSLGGLAAIQAVKQLEQRLQQGGFDAFREQMETLHQRLWSKEKHWLLIAEQEQLETQQQTIEQVWANWINRDSAAGDFTLTGSNQEIIQQAWVGNSQVHFCAKSYPTVAMNHEDAPALSVLGGVLRNGFLHRTIREQGGAYGGGASQDSGTGSFRFYSYRDPRMGDTLKDFDRALDWLQSNTVSDGAIEESILGIVGSLDKPGSPAGEARQEFHSSLSGRSQDIRKTYRERIIRVNADDLVRVADTYLKPERANTAVVTGNHGRDEAEKCGLEIIEV